MTDYDRLRWIRDNAPRTYDRMRGKAQWEHVTLLGVLKEWPNYYDDALAEVAALEGEGK